MLSICLTLIDSDDDKAKFTLLYYKYRHLMLYIADDILKDKHLAEDAVQEAFIRIARNFYKIGNITCPQTRNFVVIIAKNVAIDMYNRKEKLRAVEVLKEKKTSAFTDNTFDNIANEALIGYIMQLPEKLRVTLYLYHIYGYSYTEISNLLSITVANAQKRVQRARLMLQKMIEEDNDDER